MNARSRRFKRHRRRDRRWVERSMSAHGGTVVGRAQVPRGAVPSAMHLRSVNPHNIGGVNAVLLVYLGMEMHRPRWGSRRPMRLHSWSPFALEKTDKGLRWQFAPPWKAPRYGDQRYPHLRKTRPPKLLRAAPPAGIKRDFDEYMSRLPTRGP